MDAPTKNAQTMNAQAMIDFVDALYGATGAGDWGTVAAMLTDDFFVHEADGLPMAGIFHGVEGLRELYGKLMALADVAALDRVQTLTGQGLAVTYLRIRFADPALAPAELCEMFRFRDGRCCEIKPFYFDPATVVRASEARANGNR